MTVSGSGETIGCLLSCYSESEIKIKIREYGSENIVSGR